MPLKPATNRMAYGKVGIYGTAGSGKTRTAVEIALGLHKVIGSKKPIAAFDTEPAFSYVLPLFRKAGVELHTQDDSRALQDLMTFMDEAEKTCDIAIVDSITHVWRDAQQSYLDRINESRRRKNQRPLAALEFQHWGPIKARWAEFTDRFLSSKMHVIVCGRAGNVYEYQEKNDGSGKKELITVGTRMATEKELGYEPSLLVEMVTDREDGKLINVAIVQKDRSDSINGHEFRMPTYAMFEPHFQSLNLGGEHFGSMNARDSKAMFEEADESGWDVEKRRRTILAEEIQGLLVKKWPGQTANEKAAKADMLEAIFETRSWTKIEEATSARVLAEGLQRLKVELGYAPVDPQGEDDPPVREAA